MTKAYVLTMAVSGELIHYSLVPVPGQTVRVRAFAPAKYELVALVEGVSPQKIRVTRKGNDVWLELLDSGDVDAVPDLVIEDFYAQGDSELYGVGSDGASYQYLASESEGGVSMAQLGFDMSSDMLLVQKPAGAAVGLPLLTGPLAAGGGAAALAAAGGGGGGTDTTADEQAAVRAAALTAIRDAAQNKIGRAHV